MKNLILLYLLILTALLIVSCDKPAPTELIDDLSNNDQIEVEIIAKNTEDELYSNGYDTTGVVQQVGVVNSIISVTGGKITFQQGNTERYSIAQAIIFDKTKPVFNSEGLLVGYETITPGVVRFNNHLARLVNFRIRYRDQGTLIDSVLGKKYFLYSGRLVFNDPFQYLYDSFIPFSFQPIFGSPVSFDIPTPVEVTGNITLRGNLNNNTLGAELRWNAAGNPNFVIIIGLLKRNSLDVFPLYRIRTADDGRLIIPASLINSIPKDRFNRIAFTFVRYYDNSRNIENDKVYVSSQSIHTIYLNLP